MAPLKDWAMPPRPSMAIHFRKTGRVMFHALMSEVFHPLIMDESIKAVRESA
jgi:hypothetical protein